MLWMEKKLSGVRVARTWWAPGWLRLPARGRSAQGPEGRPKAAEGAGVGWRGSLGAAWRPAQADGDRVGIC